MKSIMLAAGLMMTGAVALAQTASEVTLDTGSGVLHGTLELPAPLPAAPVPAVLIVAGSGPTDRDGNSAVLPGKNDSLKLLADALARAGVASVRYDKRGIAGSAAAATDESTMRIERLIDDAALWVAQMRHDARFGPVAVLGHSEGALIGMVAARQAGAAAFVSIAGPARGADEVLRTQLQGKLPPDLVADSDRILAALRRGQPVAQVPAALMVLYRPSVQPYLMSWFRYVPAQEFARLAVPALIIQGGTDAQVDPAEAQALHQARPAAQLLLVPGMNHVLKEASSPTAGAQIQAYTDPALPLVPGLIDPLAGFLRRLR